MFQCAMPEALIAAHADFAYVPALMFLTKLRDRLASHPDQPRFKVLYEAMDKLALAVRASFSSQLSDSGYTLTSPLIWSPDGRGLARPQGLLPIGFQQECYAGVDINVFQIPRQQGSN